jgi:hypothetical protein
MFRAVSFRPKRETKDWASAIESQADPIAAGFTHAPSGSAVADLIDKSIETVAKVPGRTMAAPLAMLRCDIDFTLAEIALRDQHPEAGLKTL